jgi:dsDNA-binding SOS-regulon protein
MKRFEWWNSWKPGWRPLGFSSVEKESDEARRASYQARREEVLRQRRQRHQQEQRQREHEAQASQSRNGSGEKGEVIENMFNQGDKALNDWASKAAASSYDDFLIQDHHTADDVVQILIAALSRMKEERDAAISIIQTLAEERTRLRTHIAAQSGSSEQPNSLYPRVGLDEGCQSFVIKAVQSAWRKKLHPDRYPEHQRREAERQFKEAEAIFEEIKRLRGS